MTKKQLTFLIYEQMPKDFLAEFLKVDVEVIEEAQDNLLYEKIEEKVNEMSDQEIEKFV